MGGNVVTYYDILKVGRCAAPDSVRAAYRRLAQKYHPDKLPGNADAERVMAMLNEAYGVLSDPQRRASYDQRIDGESCGARVVQPGIQVPQAAWPWCVLFGTIAFATASVGTVVYKSFVPAVAATVSITPAHPAAPLVSVKQAKN